MSTMLLPIGKAGERIGISRNAMLRAIKRGRVTGTMLDGRWFVTEAAALAYRDTFAAGHMATCRKCGGLFRTLSSNEVYCSDACCTVALARKYRGQPMADAGRYSVCAHCGERYYLARSDKRYCSDACRHKAFLSRKRGVAA